MCWLPGSGAHLVSPQPRMVQVTELDDGGGPLFGMGGYLQSDLGSSGRSLKISAMVFGLCLSAVWLPTLSQASSADWQEHVRRLVLQEELAKALLVTEDRLADHPEDLEARGWRARLLAWTHRWNESEIEYRTILESAPHDIDILLGLADLLTWQGRSSESIVFLNRAAVLDPSRNDVQLRRGRAFHTLGRTAEAGAAYSHVLSLEGLFLNGRLAYQPSGRRFKTQPSVSSNLLGSHLRVGPAWHVQFNLSAILEGTNGLQSRSELTTIRFDAADSRPSSLVNLRHGAHPQLSNGMNYAIGF